MKGLALQAQHHILWDLRAAEVTTAPITISFHEVPAGATVGVVIITPVISDVDARSSRQCVGAKRLPQNWRFGGLAGVATHLRERKETSQ
jgi:hypothetical protein